MDCRNDQKKGIFLGNHGSALLVELNRYVLLISRVCVVYVMSYERFTCAVFHIFQQPFSLENVVAVAKTCQNHGYCI